MQVQKQTWLKIISVLSVFMIILFCAEIKAYAEATKDGISVTVSTDKEKYKSEDEVKLKIKVRNTNSFEVSNLKIENVLPNGISLVSGDISKDNINLNANEEQTINLSVKKEKTGNGNNNSMSQNEMTTNSPNTGEGNTILIILAIMIISSIVIVCIVKKKQNFTKFFSLFLCVLLMGKFVTAITFDVNAKTTGLNEENKSSFTTECTYVIDDYNYNHEIKITYYNIDLYILYTVDKELQETIVTDTFKNASLEERKEIALNILNKLENENKILKGSIKFNEEYNSYFFEYINGGEGSIMLGDSSSEENEIDDWKTYNISNTITSSYIPSNITKNINNTGELNKYYILNNSANRYIKENLSKNNLTYYPKKALIIDDVSIEFGENRNAFENHKKIWSSNDLKTDIKSNVTVEEFKTILIGYDFIDINAHGYIDKNGNPTVFLQESRNFSNFIKYYEDVISRRIGTYYGFRGGNFYLTSNFFSYYYSNKLSDTILWISCCEGYINDNLVSTFADECNAKSVIGVTDSVYAYYDTDMTDIFVHKLLFGLTVDEALKEAKSFYGKNSNEYRLNPKFGDGKSGKYYAEFKNYNGGNETLVELVRINNGTLSGVVTDENNNPIENAEIIINNVQGMSYGITATTNENGEYTLECSADSYKIGVKADGYETFETEDFVEIDSDKETVYNITLKKVSEPPTEPNPQITAIDLIDKSIPEIISLMHGEYQIIQTEMGGYYNGTYSGIFYIQNQSVFPGMEFYSTVTFDESVKCNPMSEYPGEEIQSDELRKNLKAGKYSLEGIQVNKSGKVSNTIQVGMDYTSCSKVLGDFDCIPGNGGYIGGSVLSVSHTYNEKNAKVILHFFDIPLEILHDLSFGKISSVSSEQMKSYNPKLENVVIRKTNETEQTVLTTESTSEEITNNFDINNYIGKYQGVGIDNGLNYDLTISVNDNTVKFELYCDSDMDSTLISMSSSIADSNTIYYSDEYCGIMMYGYGSQTRTTVYKNGTGNFLFNNDGTVTCNSDNNDNLKNCIFSRISD